MFNSFDTVYDGTSALANDFYNLYLSDFDYSIKQLFVYLFAKILLYIIKVILTY